MSGFDKLAGNSGLTGPLLLLARLFMSAEFLIFGTLKIVNTSNMRGYMEAHGVSGQFIWLAIGTQLLGGILIVIGYQTRAAALALCGFCVIASLLFHSNFSDLGEVAHFTKDLATAGGFLFLFAYGAGPLSIDAKLAVAR